MDNNELKKRIAASLEKIKKEFSKNQFISVTKAEILDIKPVMQKQLPAVSGKAISTFGKLNASDKKEAKNFFLSRFKKFAGQNDYLVRVGWHISPRRGKNVFLDKDFSKKGPNEISYLVYNRRTGKIKFDSFASTVPFGVTTSTEGKTTIHHSRKTIEFPKKTVTIHGLFGVHLRTFHYKGSLSHDDRLYYASGTVASPPMSFDVKFNMWETGMWSPNQYPIAVIGRGLSYPTICPGEGDQSLFTVDLEKGEDYFNNADLASSVDGERGGAKCNFSISKVIGTAISPTYDTDGWLSTEYPTGSMNCVTIKHTPICDGLWDFTGIYYDNGKFEFSGQVKTEGAPGHTTGTIKFRVPVYYGYLKKGAFFEYRYWSWGEFASEMRYTRGSGLREPKITIEVFGESIVVGNISRFKIKINGNNSSVGFEDIDVRVEGDSIKPILKNTGAWSQRITSLTAKETKEVEFRFEGAEVGKTTPMFYITYKYGDPVPKEGAGDKEEMDPINGPQITVKKQYVGYNYIGNKNTLELHEPDCTWVENMSEKNKTYYSSIQDALDDGYNGCAFCLEDYNTG